MNVFMGSFQRKPTWTCASSEALNTNSNAMSYVITQLPPSAAAPAAPAACRSAAAAAASSSAPPVSAASACATRSLQHQGSGKPDLRDETWHMQRCLCPHPPAPPPPAYPPPTPPRPKASPKLLNCPLPLLQLCCQRVHQRLPRLHRPQQVAQVLHVAQHRRSVLHLQAAERGAIRMAGTQQQQQQLEGTNAYTGEDGCT